MSTYSYPAFRPETMAPQGTFGLPSFGAYAHYGAADDALEKLSHWGGRVSSAKYAVTKAMGLGGAGAGALGTVQGLLLQASQLISDSNKITGGYSPNEKWTRAQEERVAGLLEKARVQYNSAAGISMAAPPHVAYPKFPTWRLAEAGVPLAASSDDPCAPLPPLETATWGTTRAVGAGTPLGPKQGLPYDDWLQAYTVGAAFAGRQEHERGQLAPGHRADLVIVEGAVDAGGGARVLETWIEGTVVHRRDDPVLTSGDR